MRMGEETGGRFEVGRKGMNGHLGKWERERTEECSRSLRPPGSNRAHLKSLTLNLK